jgi:hypothetical protein
MDSRRESGAAGKSETVRFRCDQTQQFSAAGSFTPPDIRADDEVQRLAAM